MSDRGGHRERDQIELHCSYNGKRIRNNYDNRDRRQRHKSSFASLDWRRSRSRSPFDDRRSYLSYRKRDGGYGHHHDQDSSDGIYHNQSSKEELSCKEKAIQKEKENEEDYQERIEEQLVAQEEDNVEKIKEESRQRRQEILNKYKQCQQHQQQQLIKQQPKVEVDKAPLINVLGQESPKGKLEYSSDVFYNDIFGESPACGWKIERNDKWVVNLSSLNDNWDDSEGCYCFHCGEILDGRYCVLASHGSGVFSTVVRANDSKAGKNDPNEVAIKIIRNNDFMHNCGFKELGILKKLAEIDPKNMRHCVRLLSSFKHRNHLCLVFESLQMNLRGIQNIYSHNIERVRVYAKQIFIALKHLRNCGVLHCDIKPDNILVNDAKNVLNSKLKLCDFGSAMFVGFENEITPYLVSRYYRAPEIILGLPYGHVLDMWSVGCCLYELYLGDVLFKGNTNNGMLQLHMELKGAFPKKMLKKAQFKEQYFDQDLNFYAVEEDPITKKMVKRIIRNDHFVKPKGMRHFISISGTVDKHSRSTMQFIDLLEKMLILDPSKRITVLEALHHPFILEW